MKGTPDGYGNKTMFRIASGLRGYGVPQDVTLALLFAAGRIARPPWRVAKITKDTDWVYKKYRPNPGRVGTKQPGRPTDLLTTIVDVMVEQGEPMTPTEVHLAIAARLAGERDQRRRRELPPTARAIGQMLRRRTAEGLFEQLEGGRYEVVTPPDLDLDE
jgi:hypothetical protein